MPSYFFHLKLELYLSPVSGSAQQNSFSSQAPPFTPAPGCDIFKTHLPTHRTSNWTSTLPLTPPPSSSSSDRSPARPTIPSESHGDALLLPARSTNLKDSIRKATTSRAAIKPSHETSARDWRYSKVSIEGIDMEVKAPDGAKNGVSGLHTKAVYMPSNPKTTDVGWGVVHLYRDTEESTYLDEDAFPRKSLERSRLEGEDRQPVDCTTLCILAVPSWMMPSDLLGFVGDQAREDVSHFRLIRTGRANKYMVLMKFRQAKKAREWQKEYNGRLFSAAEPENCHVVFIKTVEFLSPSTDETDSLNFPQNTNDPFISAGTTPKSISNKPFAPPPPNLLELPTCPVCLERMDETTGLLTILCQHVFHCACLEKWRGSGCPVCRYTHSPSYTFPYPRPGSGEEDVEPLCSVCASSSNLWVCLICGNIGCGRYDEAHAYAHYESTSHCYAMDITTQHVWDYAGDGYVHRLIQSKPDSKMIDMPTSQQSRHENEAFRAEGGDSVPREKMESMATEYTYLLTSQLEGQRRYFEEQVERAVDKASEASVRAEEAAAQAEHASRDLRHTREEHEQMMDALKRTEKALERSEKTRQKFEQMARDMSSQLREEKIINEGLSSRITSAEKNAEEAKLQAKKAVDEKAELEEMNRDLTMFISGQEKVRELQEQGEDIAEGDVSLPLEQKGKKGKGRKK